MSEKHWHLYIHKKKAKRMVKWIQENLNEQDTEAMKATEWFVTMVELNLADDDE